MFREILGGLLAPATEWLRQSGERARIRAEGDVKIAEAEIAGEVAAAEAAATRAQTEVEANRDWDNAAAKAAERSWKDEFWTLIVGFILVVAFVPGGAGLAHAGFQALASAPGWFQAIVGASVAFSFGIRQTLNMVRERWK